MKSAIDVEDEVSKNNIFVQTFYPFTDSELRCAARISFNNYAAYTKIGIIRKSISLSDEREAVFRAHNLWDIVFVATFISISGEKDYSLTHMCVVLDTILHEASLLLSDEEITLDELSRAFDSSIYLCTFENSIQYSIFNYLIDNLEIMRKTIMETFDRIIIIYNKNLYREQLKFN